uniref:Cancer/testis antigen 47A n=1 Tax=Mustela putorius furo TaxID=9669 RepID=M3XQP4_MUSPF
MSSSGDPGQASGQDSPVSAVGVWSLEAGGGNRVAPGVGFPQIEVAGVAGPEVALESGPPGMEVALESGSPGMEVALESGPPEMEVALHSGLPPMEVSEVEGPVGGLGEAALGLGLARGPAGMSVEAEEDDSDFGPVEEDGEEQQEEGLDILVDAHQFPMVGFRFMFLDLVHSLLHRIYHNNHILVRPRRGRVMVRPRARQPDSPRWHPAAPAGPPAWAAPAAARESEASSEEEAAWETAEEPDEESEEGPETAKGTTKFQYEKPANGANDSEREEEKDKFNKKQEGAD